MENRKQQEWSFVALSSDAAAHDAIALRKTLLRLHSDLGIEPDPGSTASAQVLGVPPSSLLKDSVNAADLSIDPVQAKVALRLTLCGIRYSPQEVVKEVRKSLGTGLVWEVSRHVGLRRDVDRSDSTVERIAFGKKRQGMTRERFMSHYLGTHVPLVMSHGPLFDRYVVNEIKQRDEWDSITQQQFSSAEQLMEHDRQLFESKPLVAADLPNFLGGVVQFTGMHKTTVGA
jgi:hypothetical protein